jgi:moderate conductance mechanosensitive channel
MDNFQTWLVSLDSWQRLLVVAAVAAFAHLVVVLVRRLSTYLTKLAVRKSRRKMTSLISLFSSFLIFSFYFAAVGFLLTELGVPIAAYLASASIIGLAVGFGSQGLVQDLVMGLTSIFSDVYDIGDMIEIGGQVGMVSRIGLRFLEIENPMGARVMIPNRSITSVINYRRGYIRCIVDITLSNQAEEQNTDVLVERLTQLANGVYEQFPGILVTRPSIEGVKQTSAGKSYLRIKFRIWPGRGAPIEQSFKQEAAQEMSSFNEKYKDWMVTVHYEVEPKVR